MTVLADTRAKPVGILQAWGSETSYPDATPFVSYIGPVHESGEPQEMGWSSGISTEDVTAVVSSHWHTEMPTAMGWAWAPWASWLFTPVIRSLTSVIPGVEFGDIVSEAAFPLRSGTSVATITVLPVSGDPSVVYAGQVATTPMSSWCEVGKVRLLLPYFSPRSFRVREALWEDTGSYSQDPRLSDAMAAIRDLTRWLNRSQSEIADICKFSLRASRYWSSGKIKVPRLSTVRRLHEVHTFVGSLVDAVGRQSAREWLDQPSPTGISRLEILAAPDGVTTLLREASPLLFADAPHPERPQPEAVEEAEAADLADAYRPLQLHGPVRRPRRAPRRGE